MKLNAPALFYSLDRLITKRDYVSYLKTLNIGENGGIIKNALAWGEQEEVRGRNQLANFRFFNIVFFSVMASLYNFPSGGTYTNVSEENIEKSFLELEDDFSIVDPQTGVVSADGFPEQSYFNILVKPDQLQPEVKRVQDYRNENLTHPITTTLNKLDQRAQTTVRTIYITPFLQKMKLTGDISIGKLEDRVTIRKTINNRIYKWLDENADFNSKIYKSDVYDLIHNTVEVQFANIQFEPNRPEQMITSWELDPDTTTNSDPSTSAVLIDAIKTEVYDFLSTAGNAAVSASGVDSSLLINEEFEGFLQAGTSGIASASYNPEKFVYEGKGHYVAGLVNEKTFYQELMANIYNACSPSWLDKDANVWRDSQYFRNVMFKLHNDLLPAIRTSIIDKEGDLTKYSLNNEIVQIEIDLNYVFV